MKKQIVSFVFALFALSAVHAQSPSDDQQAISMLREFYIAYDSAWIMNDNPVTLKSKLVLLQQRYCSSTLISDLNVIYANHGLDHDVFLNDMLPDITRFQNTLTIVKDTTTLLYSYLVSFYSVVNEPGVSYLKHTSLRIRLIKVNNAFKINTVTEI